MVVRGAWVRRILVVVRVDRVHDEVGEEIHVVGVVVDAFQIEIYHEVVVEGMMVVGPDEYYDQESFEHLEHHPVVHSHHRMERNQGKMGGILDGSRLE